MRYEDFFGYDLLPKSGYRVFKSFRSMAGLQSTLLLGLVIADEARRGQGHQSIFFARYEHGRAYVSCPISLLLDSLISTNRNLLCLRFMALLKFMFFFPALHSHPQKHILIIAERYSSCFRVSVSILKLTKRSSRNPVPSSGIAPGSTTHWYEAYNS